MVALAKRRKPRSGKPLHKKCPLLRAVLCRGLGLGGTELAMERLMTSSLSTPFFNAQECLDSVGAKGTITRYPRGAPVFVQGEPANTVLYVQNGGVLMSVLSRTGKEAVLAVLGRGNFFGESCLAGHDVRMNSATAVAPTTVLSIERATMARLLHKHPDLLDQFITHILTRNIRAEADLADQCLNSSEKRLARTLLLLAKDARDDAPNSRVPRLSQEILAGMVGTTRARVSFFMNKFRRLGFVEYNDRGIRIQKSLATVVLQD
jgi:CRP/FNR family cyclic AMP-dependent transcriptional regulator